MGDLSIYHQRIEKLISDIDSFVERDDYETAAELTYLTCIILSCFYEQSIKGFLTKLLQCDKELTNKTVKKSLIDKVRAEKTDNLINFFKRNVEDQISENIKLFFKNNPELRITIDNLIFHRHRIAHTGRSENIAQNLLKQADTAIKTFNSYLEEQLEACTEPAPPRDA